MDRRRLGARGIIEQPPYRSQRRVITAESAVRRLAPPLACRGAVSGGLRKRPATTSISCWSKSGVLNDRARTMRWSLFRRDPRHVGGGLVGNPGHRGDRRSGDHHASSCPALWGARSVASRESITAALHPPTVYAFVTGLAPPSWTRIRGNRQTDPAHYGSVIVVLRSSC